jgi:hypothetical protein
MKKLKVSNKNKRIDEEKQKLWSDISNECKGGHWHYSTDVKLLFFLALSVFLIVLLIMMVYNKDDIENATKKIRDIHSTSVNNNQSN